MSIVKKFCILPKLMTEADKKGIFETLRDGDFDGKVLRFEVEITDALKEDGIFDEEFWAHLDLDGNQAYFNALFNLEGEIGHNSTHIRFGPHGLTFFRGDEKILAVLDETEVTSIQVL